MNRLPTLLVLANTFSDSRELHLPGRSPSPEEQALRQFDTLHDTLHKGLESGLPLILIASRDIANRARKLLPGNCVVELTDNQPKLLETGVQSDDFAKAIVAGVLASAQANGWLILPTGFPLLRAETLRRLAEVRDHQPIVIPQYQQLDGYPVRFSAEFFSELIRLQSERDLHRLITRYPTQSVEVNDPGVLVTKSNSNPIFSIRREDEKNIIGVIYQSK